MTFHPTPEHLTAGINVLAAVIAELRGDSRLLTANCGGDPYESSTFSLSAYCWCAGAKPGHEDECPPNFMHHASGLRVDWYKHAGRGSVTNQALNAAQCAAVINSCLTDLAPQALGRATS